MPNNIIFYFTDQPRISPSMMAYMMSPSLVNRLSPGFRPLIIRADSMMATDGSPSIFFSSIYCIIFLVLIVVAVGAIVRGKLKERQPHTGWGEKALSNLTPSRASWSRLGGISRGWPQVPHQAVCQGGVHPPGNPHPHHRDFLLCRSRRYPSAAGR